MFYHRGEPGRECSVMDVSGLAADVWLVGLTLSPSGPVNPGNPCLPGLPWTKSKHDTWKCTAAPHNTTHNVSCRRSSVWVLRASRGRGTEPTDNRRQNNNNNNKYVIILETKSCFEHQSILSSLKPPGHLCLFAVITCGFHCWENNRLEVNHWRNSAIGEVSSVVERGRNPNKHFTGPRESLRTFIYDVKQLKAALTIIKP